MAKNFKNKGKPNGKGRNDYRGGKNAGRDFVPDQRSASPDQRSRKGDNDISWYSGYPQLMRDVSSIPFNVFPGVPRSLDYAAVAKSTGSEVGESVRLSGKYATPGICTINYVPTIGVSTDSTSAVNVASRALYTYLRGMNSGKTNYEATDAFLYCLAASEVYAYYAYLCRIYGSIRYWDAQNRYAGKYIVRALGVNYDSMVAVLTNLRAYINYFATQINKLAVPTAIPLFARRIWCETGIYRDDDLNKSQFYAMKREGWLYYEEMTGESTYGRLNLIPVSAPLELADLMEIGTNLLEPLMASEDINIISGDILKAFGNSGLAAAPQIAEDYICVPEYNPEVLLQFKNTRFNLSSIAHLNYPQWITQDPEKGIIISKPQANIMSSGHFVPEQAMIDVGTNNVTPEMVMIATRLITRWVPDSYSEPTEMQLDVVGTELPLNVSHYSVDGSGYFSGINYLSSYYDDSDAVGGSSVTTQDLIATSQYNSHPIIETMFVNAESNSAIVYGPVGNVTNLTYSDMDQIKAMHDVACISMFRVPGMKEFNER